MGTTWGPPGADRTQVGPMLSPHELCYLGLQIWNIGQTQDTQWFCMEYFVWYCVFMPPPLGAGGIMFSGCPSVSQSEAQNTLFPPVHRSVGPSDQPLPFYGMSVCPSVRPERFLGICWRTHGGNGLKFYMLMYLDHLQNWLDYGYGLLIFLLLTPLWLSETGQIWGFQAFPRERMEGLAWNFTCWCILNTFRTY